MEYACQENRLLKLEGFGEKSQAKILAGIGYIKGNLGRFLFAEVVELAELLEETVSGWKEVQRAAVAGSYRRRKETVKDLDIVASSRNPKAVMGKFVAMQGVTRIVARGDTKTSLVWKNNLPIDLRVVSDAEFAYALHHFTGSKEHNTALRTRAKEMGFKMNEYGLFKGEKLVPCKDGYPQYSHA